MLESATWRSNPDWGAVIGYAPEALDRANAAAIDLMRAIRDAEETAASPMVLSGCIGPRGDGYAPDSYMTAEEAEAYHERQVRVFERAGADIVTAITMTYVEEGIGVARAAKAAGMPAVVSFTVETDGRLRTGHGRSARRSRPATRRPAATRSTTWSTARIRRISATRLAGGWRRADRRGAGERLEDEPCRARRRAGARSGRSGRARPATTAR